MNPGTEHHAAGFAGTPLNTQDAARLGANICEIMQHRLPAEDCCASSLSRIFDLGVEAFAEATYTEVMRVAIEKYLETKRHLRPSSYQECRNVLRCMVRKSPGIAAQTVRSLRARDCLEMITTAYHTPHTFDKARRLLNCFFRYALQQNWCDENPVRRLQVKRLHERTISALMMDEIYRLLEQAASPKFRNCAAAVGVMLWAGIRPTEVSRLYWRDVDLEERVVHILPRVSKTGGARLVHIQPILKRWLKRFRCGAQDDDLLVPANWARRWCALREASGLNPWHPDTLRHTFASYYLRYFRNIYHLQMEMGHSSAKLLFSRYLNMQGISLAAAAAFWGRKVRKYDSKDEETDFFYEHGILEQ